MNPNNNGACMFGCFNDQRDALFTTSYLNGPHSCVEPKLKTYAQKLLNGTNADGDQRGIAGVLAKLNDPDIGHVPLPDICHLSNMVWGITPPKSFAENPLLSDLNVAREQLCNLTYARCRGVQPVQRTAINGGNMGTNAAHPFKLNTFATLLPLLASIYNVPAVDRDYSLVPPLVQALDARIMYIHIIKDGLERFTGIR